MKKYLLIAFAAGAASVSGCRKEECNAGVGGDFTLQIYPQHHGEPIPGATCFLEFNAQSSPASASDFDLTVEAGNGSDFIVVKNMRCGDYYISCVGIDVDSASSEIVRGGIPYSISQRAGGEVLKIYVPVSE